jgi:hypothetical protein
MGREKTGTQSLAGRFGRKTWRNNPQTRDPHPQGLAWKNPNEDLLRMPRRLRKGLCTSHGTPPKNSSRDRPHRGWAKIGRFLQPQPRGGLNSALCKLRTKKAESQAAGRRERRSRLCGDVSRFSSNLIISATHNSLCDCGHMQWLPRSQQVRSSGPARGACIRA